MIADEILKTALLGTDKYMPNPAPGLETLTEKIGQQTAEKEDQFLKIAIATLLYEEAGNLPLKTDIALPECPPEQQAVINDQLAGYLQIFLREKDEILLRYFTCSCNQKKLVVKPELVPLVLNKALEHKKKAQPLISICGETGKWLGGLNAQWQLFYTGSPNDEHTWETGTPEQRKQYFTELRARNPGEAIKLLEQSFPQENAASRSELIELLRPQLSINDEPFLQSLSKDKSQKVKEAAIGLLKTIPGSAVNQLYLDFVLKTITNSNSTISINSNTIPDEIIFKSGIDKVSNQKGVKDHTYWLGQMLACIDPEMLAGKLSISEEALLAQLLQYKDAGALQPYLIRAAVQFGNKAWALYFLPLEDVTNIDLLNVLEPAERTDYYAKFLQINAAAVIHYIQDERYTIIPLLLAEQILQQLAKSPYQIQGPDYRQLALYLPDGITGTLQHYQQDQRTDYQMNYFRNQVTEMLRVLDIRKNIQ